MKQYLVFLLAWTFVFAVALGENVSVTLLSREFAIAVNNIDGPARLAVNVPIQKFARDFTLATGYLLIDLSLEYYRQARLTSNVIVNDWKSCTQILLEEVERVPHEDSKYLEKYLNDVTKYLNEFFLMEPGNLEARETKNLPQLPTDTGPVLTHYENYEPRDLFVNLEKLVDQDITSVHNFVEKIYTTGWQGARHSLSKFQQQFRDEFLHCIFLKMWLEETKKIDVTSRLLRKHVRPRTWSEYENLSERVKLVAKTSRLDKEFCGKV